MTDFNIPEDDIRDLIRELARKQNTTQDQIQATDEHINRLSDEITRVLASNTFNNAALAEMRENHELTQQRILNLVERQERNFSENQRSTNAALDKLEAILVQLTRIDRNGN